MNDVIEFLTANTRKAGRELTLHALKLWYVAKSSDTPPKAKAIIAAALVYLGLPADAVPDFLPIVGFTDDMTILATALLAVHMHITTEVEAAAEAQLDAWFA